MNCVRQVCYAAKYNARQGLLRYDSSNMYMQIRHKGKLRARLPAVAKEKDKFVTIKKTIQLEDPRVLSMKPKEKEIFLKRKPVDDVWLAKYYPEPTYSCLEIIRMHKEYAAPDMLDNSTGYLTLELYLDMRAKKKNRFIPNFRDTVLLPHFFDDGQLNKVVALAKTDEDKLLAERSGAAFIGGVELVKSIEKGDLRHDDFDYIVCTVDLIADIGRSKKHLKEKFPSKDAGTLGGDIVGMVEKFTKGKSYFVSKPQDDIGMTSFKFGTMDMDDKALAANIVAFIKSVCTHRSPTLGRFIQKAYVTAVPSPERLKLDESELEPKEEITLVTEAVQEIEAEDPEPEIDAPANVDSDDEQPSKASTTVS